MITTHTHTHTQGWLWDRGGMHGYKATQFKTQRSANIHQEIAETFKTNLQFAETAVAYGTAEMSC